LEFRDDAAGRLLVIPEPGLPHLFFKFLFSRELGRQVKESRGWRSSAPQDFPVKEKGFRGSCYADFLLAGG
ncbi:MAG: hypothetical protein ACREJC_04375, partial [Tepidisphaeraceae bacterium]